MSRVARRNARRRRKLNPAIVIIPVVVLLLAGAVYVFITDYYGLASSLRGLLTASKLEMFDEDGLRIVEGDFTITEAGTVLEDHHVLGNLYLTPDIGDGSIELHNIIVDGAVFIQGGGLNTVRFADCNFPEIRVNRPQGRVRLVALGQSVVDSTLLETGARLVENLAEEAEGFRKVEVVTAEKVELSGSYETIRLSMKDAYVEINSDELEELIVTREAIGSAVKYNEGMVLQRLYLDGAVFLLGPLGVNEAYLSAPGLNELAGNYNEVRVTAEAGHFELLGPSTFAEIVVAKDALNNVLTLEPEVTVAYLELNEAVEMKGAGTIELVIVNAPGSTMEQIPLDIDFGEEVSIEIAGHEIKSSEMLRALIEHGDPNYYAATSETETAQDPDPAPTPEPEPEPAPEPAPDPEPDPEPEYDPVTDFEFIVEDGLTPGMKMVIVKIDVSDPQNYSVTVADTPLGYNDDAKRFWGEISEADAVRENVVVSR